MSFVHTSYKLEYVAFAAVALSIIACSLLAGANAIALNFPLDKVFGISVFCLAMGIPITGMLWLVMRIDPLATNSRPNMRRAILWRCAQSLPASTSLLLVVAIFSGLTAFGLPSQGGGLCEQLFVLNVYHLGVPVVLAGVFCGTESLTAGRAPQLGKGIST